MACSSCSLNHKHVMFLSFRGVYSRYIFTRYFLKALKGADIVTFLDDETIKTREDLKPELVIGIKESRASIIVLSKNDASSSWCLDELVLILEQLTLSSVFVLPIFYQVEPTHIRKHEDTFGEHKVKVGEGVY